MSESKPLLRTELSDALESEVKRTAAVRKYAWPVTAGLVVTVLVAGVALVSMQSRSVPERTSSTQKLAEAESTAKETAGWYIYKAAFIAANSTKEKALDFLQRHSGGFSCEDVPLGCAGAKLTCTFGYANDKDNSFDKQLHYVWGPKLFSHAKDGDNLGADGWYTVQKQSLNNMSGFSPFIHNKVTLYVQDIVAKKTSLENDNWPTMLRYYEDTERGTIGSVMTEVAGQVWEFVGSIPTASAIEHGFSQWLEEECPVAHKVNANFDLLKQLPISQDYNGSVWIGQGIGTGNIYSLGMQTAFDHLRDLTKAKMEYYEDTHCKVMSIMYRDYQDQDVAGRYGDDVVLKVVENSHYQALSSEFHPGLTMSDYEQYIARVHKRYLSRPYDEEMTSRWREWDHYLDMHVGIKFEGDNEGYGCDDIAKHTNEMLIKDHDAVSVGKRAIENDGDHYYSGYYGLSMTVEYNTEPCHYGVGETAVCACTMENSDLLAYQKRNFSYINYDCIDEDDEF